VGSAGEHVDGLAQRGDAEDVDRSDEGSLGGVGTRHDEPAAPERVSGRCDLRRFGAG